MKVAVAVACLVIGIVIGRFTVPVSAKSETRFNEWQYGKSGAKPYRTNLFTDEVQVISGGEWKNAKVVSEEIADNERKHQALEDNNRARAMDNLPPLSR